MKTNKKEIGWISREGKGRFRSQRQIWKKKKSYICSWRSRRCPTYSLLSSSSLLELHMQLWSLRKQTKTLTNTSHHSSDKKDIPLTKNLDNSQHIVSQIAVCTKSKLVASAGPHSSTRTQLDNFSSLSQENKHKHSTQWELKKFKPT